MYSLKRRFQQNQNDCVFTVLSLLPTLGDQILVEMNIEAAWAKLQESRKLEKKEELLKRQQQQKEKEEAEAKAKAEESATVKSEEGEGEQTNEKEENNKSSEENVEGQNDEDDKKKKDDVDNNNNTEEKTELENSVGSLGASTTTLTDDNTQSKVLEGILDKKAKYLLWEEIKASSMFILD